MYQNYMPYYQQFRQHKLPPQQALKANGKASIDMLDMSPDSDVLIMDTTAPRVWYCVSDGLGNVKATPYRIEVETGVESVPAADIEQRIYKIESTLADMEERLNDKPYVDEPDTRTKHSAYKGTDEYDKELR